MHEREAIISLNVGLNVVPAGGQHCCPACFVEKLSSAEAAYAKG